MICPICKQSLFVKEVKNGIKIMTCRNKGNKSRSACPNFNKEVRVNKGN